MINDLLEDTKLLAKLMEIEVIQTTLKHKVSTNSRIRELKLCIFLDVQSTVTACFDCIANR